MQTNPRSNGLLSVGFFTVLSLFLVLGGGGGEKCRGGDGEGGGNGDDGGDCSFGKFN